MVDRSVSILDEPKQIGEILGWNLEIPNYQRPYRWKAKHVADLLSDVEDEMRRMENEDTAGSYRYRIGSIILHGTEKEGKAIEEVVDGQQRLLTLCLILREIKADFRCTLLGQQFTIADSLNNLAYNNNFIKKYFRQVRDADKTAMADYILNHCEMVVVKTSSITDAFQLFDSQNARGKTLDPTDLLKAYHLRYMRDPDEMRMCVRRWEESIDQGLLVPVISRILYRTRCWLRGETDRYSFTNYQLDEFKGIDINLFDERNNAQVYPYCQRLYVTSQVNVFSIDEPIVNGKRFFDYVAHYISLYHRLIPMEKGDNASSKHLITDNCYYARMHRQGDSRLRNLLYCLLLAYYDKFGAQGYDDFFTIVYQFVFRERVRNKRVSRETIGKLLDKENYTPQPFEWIRKSYQPSIQKLRSVLPAEERNIKKDDLNKNVSQMTPLRQQP